MARRTKEEAQVTRERLLDAAEAIFRERGVTRTSLAEVAAAAGLTRGAVYWHFKDKADLFRAMCDRATLPLDAMFESTRQRHVLGSAGHAARAVDRRAAEPGGRSARAERVRDRLPQERAGRRTGGPRQRAPAGTLRMPDADRGHPAAQRRTRAVAGGHRSPPGDAGAARADGRDHARVGARPRRVRSRRRRRRPSSTCSSPGSRPARRGGRRPMPRSPRRSRSPRPSDFPRHRQAGRAGTTKIAQSCRAGRVTAVLASAAPAAMLHCGKRGIMTDPPTNLVLVTTWEAFNA